jgi:hypothetical protein
MTVIGPEAYPPRWPDGWPRTPSYDRDTDYRFEGKGFTPGRARDLLLDELPCWALKTLCCVIQRAIAP